MIFHTPTRRLGSPAAPRAADTVRLGAGSGTWSLQSPDAPAGSVTLAVRLRLPSRRSNESYGQVAGRQREWQRDQPSKLDRGQTEPNGTHQYTACGSPANPIRCFSAVHSSVSFNLPVTVRRSRLCQIGSRPCGPPSRPRVKPVCTLEAPNMRDA